MTAPHVCVSNLTRNFRTCTALSDCSLEIRSGEVFGLLGPNGAGKSTLLRLIMGFLRPSSGTARVRVMDCYSQRVQVHREVTYLPGDARLFRSMNGRQVLRFFSGIRTDGSYTRALDIARRMDLDLSRWVAFMSTGMRQKLALAVVLSVATPLVILDEPTANLDPTVRGQVLRMIEEIRNEGRTVIFSSHVLSEVEEVCDRVAILRAGRLVHEHSMADLRRRYRIEGRIRDADFSRLIPLAETFRHDPESGRLTVEVTGGIQSILHWLAENPVGDLQVAPCGLRGIYEQFHSVPVEQVV